MMNFTKVKQFFISTIIVIIIIIKKKVIVTKMYPYLDLLSLLRLVYKLKARSRKYLTINLVLYGLVYLIK